MSIKVMSLVWENYKKGGSEKLAMLALADWCNDAGGSLHPSIMTIANKINVSESQARRIIHNFINDGYLTVIANHNGGDKGQSRHYKLNIEMLSTPSMDATPCTSATPSMDATPCTSATPSMDARLPLAPMRATPSMDDTLTTIEPPIEPPIKRVREKSIETTLADYLNLCKEKLEQPIPETDSIFEYANKCEIPLDFLHLAWIVFKDKFLDSDKKQKCWKTTFRNYVKSDYLKVWYFKDGVCILTNVGLATQNMIKKAA